MKRKSSAVGKRATGAEKLGRTQKLVLHLLAESSKSAQHLCHDWPGLTTGGARAAVNRLAMRGLVDATGWDENQRKYGLTDEGLAVERSLIEEWEDWR